MIADEPISALDVSIQAQILNLLERLQRELNLTLLFISHDLRAVQHISDRICVMYLGKIVELAPAVELYAAPADALHEGADLGRAGDWLCSDPRRRIVLTGDVPSPVDPPSGCRFRTRCPYAISECSQINAGFAGDHTRTLGGMYSHRSGRTGYRSCRAKEHPGSAVDQTRKPRLSTGAALSTQPKAAEPPGSPVPDEMSTTPSCITNQKSRVFQTIRKSLGRLALLPGIKSDATLTNSGN